jgi:hypothetical protein
MQSGHDYPRTMAPSLYTRSTPHFRSGTNTDLHTELPESTITFEKAPNFIPSIVNASERYTLHQNMSQLVEQCKEAETSAPRGSVTEIYSRIHETATTEPVMKSEVHATGCIKNHTICGACTENNGLPF